MLILKFIVNFTRLSPVITVTVSYNPDLIHCVLTILVYFSPFIVFYTQQRDTDDFENIINIEGMKKC